MPIRAELMTRPGCHLCDEMRRALERASDGLDVHIVEVDVSERADLEELYGQDVPVLLLEGRRTFEHRARERDIRRRLRALSRGTP